METFSFRSAVVTGAFQQLALIDHDEFGRKANDRGLGLAFATSLRKRLEEWDKAGVLEPVAFRRPGSTELVFREEMGFVPWRDYIEDGPTWSFKAFYSPWQILYAPEAVDLATGRVSLDWLLDTDRAVSDPFRMWFTAQRDRWRTLQAAWSPIVRLLVRVQNRYFPLIRGTLTTLTTNLVRDPSSDEYVDPYDAEVSRFKPQAVLEELGLSAEDIPGIHQRLAVHGHMRDPLTSFYMLVRMMPFRTREKLKGKARQAQDAYDAAEVLRRLVHDLTGDLLPTPDEVFDGTGGRWKKTIFGHGPQLQYSHRDVQVELGRHGLYPHVLHFVVEGESDEILIRGLIEALGGREASERGVRFSRLDGVDRVRLHRALLRAAKDYAQVPILVADREGDIEREVERLKKDGLLRDETTFLWRSSLEEDNFTDTELVEAAARIGQRAGVDVRIDAAMLRSAYERRAGRVAGQGRKGIADVLLNLAARPGHGPVRISKRELATELLDLLLRELEETEDSEENLVRRRPVLDVVFKALRST